MIFDRIKLAQFLDHLIENFLLEVTHFFIRILILLFKGDSKSNGQRKPTNHKMGICIPILPDLSHTWMYRLALDIKERFPDCALLAFIKGERDIIHPEARTLLEFAEFIPQTSRRGLLIRILKACFLYPRRTVRAIRLFWPGEAEHPYFFLEKNAEDNFLNPVHGFLVLDWIKKHRIGHLHGLGATFNSTSAIVAATLAEIPFSLSSIVDFEYPYPYKNYAKKIELAQFVVVSTEYCKKQVMKITSERYSNKIHTIYLCVSLRYPESPSPKFEIKGRPLIFACGRLTAKKGYLYLIRAMGRVAQKIPDLRCIIIGSGKEEEKLREEIITLSLGENVQILPPISNDRLKSYYAQDILLVQPSVFDPEEIRDGIPSVIFEAMAYGRPIIGTNFSGIPEVVMDGYNGFIIAPQETDALARAIGTLSLDSSLRKEMGEHSKALFKQKFNSEHQFQRLTQIFCSG